MAELDYTNFLSTPAGYATQAQIESARAYAKALQAESTTPVKHWTMGVSNMLAALAGGMEQRRADTMERGQREQAARILGGDTTTVPAAAAQPGGTAPAGDYYARLRQVESGGDPNARTGSYSGPYQLSAADRKGYGSDAEAVRTITERNRRALTQQFGRPPTDAELYMAHQQGIGGAISHYSNPDQPAWRSMRNTAEGQARGDDWAKAAIWGNMTPQMKAQFPGGVDTVPSRAFTGLWAQRFGGGAPQTAAGTPPVSAPAGAATVAPGAAALTGTPAAGAGTASMVNALAPGTAPPVTTAQTDPQTEVNHKAAQFIRTGMDPALAMKLATESVEARNKFAPQFSADPHGWEMKTVLGQAPQYTGRRFPGHVGYKESPWKGVVEITDAPGGAIRHIVMQPQFGTPPAAAAPPSAAPAAPKLIPAAAPGALPAATPVPAAAAGAQPKESVTEYITRQAQEHPVKVASPTEMIGKSVQESMMSPSEAAAAKTAAETRARVTTEDWSKTHGKINKMAEDAQNEYSNMQLLSKIVQNPAFYSGIGAKTVADISMGAKALGLGNAQSATLLQLADKLGSGVSLEDVRELGQSGAGAVRVPEMKMIKASNFDVHNTPEANRAVIEVHLRMAQRRMEVADAANTYREIHGGLDDNFFKQMRAYYKDKPLISDDEMKQFEAAIPAGKKAEGPITAPAGPAAPLPPPPSGFKIKNQ